MILNGRVKKLVPCYQDRLLRFANELIYILCNHFGVEGELIEHCNLFASLYANFYFLSFLSNGFESEFVFNIVGRAFRYTS